LRSDIPPLGQLEIQKIETQNFFTFLQPKKTEFVGVSKKQLASLFGAGSPNPANPFRIF